MWGNSLTRKLRLISKLLTSQPAKQTITICILPNISRSKDNQALRFGQLIKCTSLFFKKALYEVKASGLHLNFSITNKINKVIICRHNVNKMYFFDFRFMFPENKEDFFSSAQRSRVVTFKFSVFLCLYFCSV